jgi:hypothetical protein
VGHYLFALAVLYSVVAAMSTMALAMLDFPIALMWGVLMGLVSFLPFIGSPIAIGVVPLLRAQCRGGVRGRGTARQDVGCPRRHRGRPPSDPAQHHCGASAVAALVGGVAV